MFYPLYIISGSERSVESVIALFQISPNLAIGQSCSCFPFSFQQETNFVTFLSVHAITTRARVLLETTTAVAQEPVFCQPAHPAAAPT